MISAVIITLNEEDKIVACIESLSSICDECIVIDAESTDQTVQIAQQLGAKVHIHKWEGYGAARNYGASIAQNQWILSIDADERLSPELSKNISHFPQQNNIIYRFNRLTQYCGQWIKHGTWHPEWKEKLYHRDYYQWDDRCVHERIIPLQKQEKFSKLSGLLLHEAYATHEELEYKLEVYARLFVHNRNERQSSTSRIKRFISPKYHFLRSYIWRRGFLDGMAGYKIARAIATYHGKKLDINFTPQASRIASRTKF